MFNPTGSDDLRLRHADLLRRVELARPAREVLRAGAAGTSDATPWRLGIGARLVRAGARVAGLRPERTWDHILEHSYPER
jgi:hypothetical protein